MAVPTIYDHPDFIEVVRQSIRDGRVSFLTYARTVPHSEGLQCQPISVHQM